MPYLCMDFHKSVCHGVLFVVLPSSLPLLYTFNFLDRNLKSHLNIKTMLRYGSSTTGMIVQAKYPVPGERGGTPGVVTQLT